MNDEHRIRDDFPIYTRNPELIFLDNAGTTQKPRVVLQAMSDFYAFCNAPVHRGMYRLAEEATYAYEQARETIAKFIGASSQEVIFTANATESINFVAATWGMQHLNAGDEIVLTQLEHHSNIIPWLHLAQQKNLTVRYIPVQHDGTLCLDTLEDIITHKTKLVACIDVSNAIGTRVNSAPIIARARDVGALVLIDACQSIGHGTVNVQEYNCDFLVFSGHKMLGPTGIGVLYIKQEIQSQVPPYKYGGGMVLSASYDQFSVLPPPGCYQAGTPPIAQAIGLAAAATYITDTVKRYQIHTHYQRLIGRLLDGLLQLPDVSVLGPLDALRDYGTIVSFVHNKHHFHDVGAFLDSHHIAVRTGHYCAQPLAKALHIDGSVRVSIYLYNSIEEIDTFIKILSLLS
jgi:cysteine desulfurase / selenocysteine lyase